MTWVDTFLKAECPEEEYEMVHTYGKPIKDFALRIKRLYDVGVPLDKKALYYFLRTLLAELNYLDRTTISRKEKHNKKYAIQNRRKKKYRNVKL